VAKARATVLSTISQRTGCERIDKFITNEIINTPSVWEEKFNLNKGAILGLSHNFMNVLSFRPQIKAKGVKNAYFVGASTHPGTGVPIVLAGAKITTELILEEKGLRVPWKGKEPVMREHGVPQNKYTSELDKIRPPLWSNDAVLAYRMIISVLVLSLLWVFFGGVKSQGMLRIGA
jgi:phytoene desaturase (3,4-didehydrolycopene-forming)